MSETAVWSRSILGGYPPSMMVDDTVVTEVVEEDGEHVFYTDKRRCVVLEVWPGDSHRDIVWFEARA